MKGFWKTFWGIISGIFTPSPPPPPPPPPPSVKEKKLADKIKKKISELEAEREKMGHIVLGPLTNNEFCPKAMKLAREITNLLNEYHNLPNMNKATHAKMKSDFLKAEERLSSFCTEYSEEALK